MPFAIKLTHRSTVKYYSQTITTMDQDDFTEIILLTDGKDAEEVDVSRTLVQAEKKLEQIIKYVPDKVEAKIIEFPEVIEYDQDES